MKPGCPASQRANPPRPDGASGRADAVMCGSNERPPAGVRAPARARRSNASNAPGPRQRPVRRERPARGGQCLGRWCSGARGTRRPATRRSPRRRAAGTRHARPARPATPGTERKKNPVARGAAPLPSRRQDSPVQGRSAGPVGSGAVQDARRLPVHLALHIQGPLLRTAQRHPRQPIRQSPPPAASESHPAASDAHARPPPLPVPAAPRQRSGPRPPRRRVPQGSRRRTAPAPYQPPGPGHGPWLPHARLAPSRPARRRRQTPRRAEQSTGGRAGQGVHRLQQGCGRGLQAHRDRGARQTQQGVRRAAQARLGQTLPIGATDSSDLAASNNPSPGNARPEQAPGQSVRQREVKGCHPLRGEGRSVRDR